MKLKRVRRSVCRLSAVAAAVLQLNDVMAAPRPWVSADFLSVRYVAAYPNAPLSRVGYGLDSSAIAPVLASPSGEHFFFTSTWGDLKNDVDVCELNVYRTADVREWLARGHDGQKLGLRPFRRVQLRSRGPRQAAIESAIWNSQGTAVLFLGMTANGTRQVHRLDVNTGSLDLLTNAPYRYPDMIEWFSSSGEGVLYGQRESGTLPQPTYPAEWVERRADGSIWRDAELYSLRARKIARYVIYKGGPARRLPPEADGLQQGDILNGSRLWLSPDGRYVIGTVFEFINVTGSARKQAVGRFLIVDVATAEVTHVTGLSPGIGRSRYPGSELQLPLPAVYWSADSRRMVLVNAAVSESSQGSGPSLIEYELASGKARVLESLVSGGGAAASYVASITWLKPGEELLVTHEVGGQRGSGTVYSFTPSGVASRAAPSTMQGPSRALTDLASGVSVRVAQSSNDPPMVIASDGRHEASLTAPDPALAAVALMRTEHVQWSKENGEVVKAGLTMPRSFTKGNPVPLVIQAYHYEPSLFLPEGSSRASNAAQALASRGIAVLQMAVPRPVTSSNPHAEGPALLSNIEVAVSELARAGIVDATRVALTGHSRAGYITYYAVTHPGRVRLAAAVASDSFTGTYGGYLIQAGANGPGAIRPLEIGPGVFWENKREWLNHERSFNVDKAVTPLLISVYGKATEIAQRDAYWILDVIGAYALNRKPLEYLYLPQASHVIVRPLERLVMFDGVLDWMSFWLQGYEDPSPNKARQYARWRLMRSQHLNSSSHVATP